MTQICVSLKPTPTPLPCEATKPEENAKTESHKRRAEYGKRATERPSECRDREAREVSLSADSRGRWDQKGHKRENRSYAEKIEKCKNAGAVGRRVKNLASKTLIGRKSVSERATCESQLARGMDMDIALHPAGTASKPTGELPGNPPHEN